MNPFGGSIESVSTTLEDDVYRISVEFDNTYIDVVDVDGLIARSGSEISYVSTKLFVASKFDRYKTIPVDTEPECDNIGGETVSWETFGKEVVVEYPRS